FGKLGGAFAEILFEDDAGVVDDERHHAGVQILGRIGDEREPPDHLAAHDVVERAAGRCGSLPREDLVVVAVEGRAATADAIAFAGGLSHEFAKRALLISLRGRPIEPVLLAGPTDDALRVDADTIPGPVFLGVFVLRIRIGEAGLNRVELVAADAAIEDFEA